LLSAEAEVDKPVDAIPETDSVKPSVVSDETVLGVFVPLSKEMAGVSI